MSKFEFRIRPTAVFIMALALSILSRPFVADAHQTGARFAMSSQLPVCRVMVEDAMGDLST
jgi:hypothetical protein